VSLYIVKDGERFVWVAARLGADIYTYVPNTGKFHRNEGLRDDFFMEQDLQYEETTVTGAKAAIEAGLEPLDEQVMADHLTDWRADSAAFDPEQVFAAVVADLR
jgi:hypothetical protein